MKGLLYWSQYLPLGMLDWGNGGVSPDGVGPRHVANGIKRAREHLLYGNYVLACHCGSVSCLSWAGVGAASSRGLGGQT